MFSACFLRINVLFNELVIHPRLGHAAKPSSPHRGLRAPPDLAVLPPSHLLHLQAPSLWRMNFYSSLTVMLSLTAGLLHMLFFCLLPQFLLIL